jgi:hypothetical protein
MSAKRPVDADTYVIPQVDFETRYNAIRNAVFSCLIRRDSPIKSPIEISYENCVKLIEDVARDYSALKDERRERLEKGDSWQTETAHKPM